MVRVSNFIVGLVNTLLMVLGLGALGYSLYIFLHGATNCEKALQNPLLITGSFLFIVSLLGVIGSCGKNNFVLWLYLVVLFLLIVALIVFSIFAFFITNEGAGRVVSGRGFKQYKTADFSNWLRDHFADGKRWEEIRTCLTEAGVCRSLGDDNDSQIEARFYKTNLSPIQSGCCKPPSDCNFEFKNATWWLPPKAGGSATTTDIDCTAWSNEQNQLCFSCNSCKAGILANIKQKWRYLLIFNICLIILSITLYMFGCCARSNNRTDKKRFGA